jgi:hypothetical protein
LDKPISPETVRILRVPSSSKTFNPQLAASDPFLDSERLISGLFYDPDDFVFAEIVHGTTLLLHVHYSHIVQK